VNLATRSISRYYGAYSMSIAAFLKAAVLADSYTLPKVSL
jgi:hypothetical protein